MSQTNKVITGWQRLFCLATMMLAIDSHNNLNNSRLVMAQPGSPTPTKQPAKQRNTQRKPWLIEKILGLLQPRQIPGGSRAGNGIICTDSPVFKPDRPLLWTRQPLFVWRGDAKSVRVIEASSKRVIWEKEVDSSTEQLRIDRPLEFGKRYLWQVVTDPGNDVNNPKVEFQIVDKSQWQKIDRELKTLDQSFAIQKLDTEQIALERVKYFAQMQMWGDITEIVNSLPDQVRKNQVFLDLKNKIADELSNCIIL